MRKLTTEEFILKAELKHNSTYGYGKSKYVNSRTKVMITCHVHGDFEQTANNHLNGHGCPICANESTALINRKSQEEFLYTLKQVHEDIYDYSRVVYKNMHTNILVGCSVHGYFKISAQHHYNGVGCAKCSGNSLSSLEEFIVKASKVHNNYYSYQKAFYINSKLNVTITCPIHGEFEQSPNNHLQGAGCPSCSKTGFSPNKSAILYYLEILTSKGEYLYKIGITNKSINRRYSSKERSIIKVLKERYYPNGMDALKAEQEILLKHAEYKYSGPNILLAGNTELFTIDILKFSNEYFVIQVDKACSS